MNSVLRLRFQELHDQFGIFTVVTSFDMHVRNIFRSSRNDLYFSLLIILRTYGTYVDNETVREG